MKVVVGVLTDVGLVREGNEDAYLTDDPLYAIADGVGGARGGEVASQLALATLVEVFRDRKGGLADNVQEANRRVFERSIHDRKVAGMGTTLTAAVVEGDRIRLAHVGDSRAYLLRGGELRLLTEDHTLVQRMVAAGEITKEEAAAHPHRNVITRVLGVDPAVQVDEGLIEVREADRLLLCTDGLTGMLTEEQIQAVLEETPDPQEAAERLVRAANRAGGVDNTTVVVLDFVPGDDPISDQGGAGGRLDAQAGGPAPQGSPLLTTAPRGPRPSLLSRIRPRRLALALGVLFLVTIVVIVGLRMYLDSQWYVGVANGHVAVYRGIPATIGGFELHHVVEETRLSAAGAESLAIWRDLPAGKTAPDRQSAEAIVEQIRTDLSRLPGGPSP